MRLFTKRLVDSSIFPFIVFISDIGYPLDVIEQVKTGKKQVKRFLLQILLVVSQQPGESFLWWNGIHPPVNNKQTD